MRRNSPIFRGNTTVLLVEEELPTLQKEHDDCYYFRRNGPLFIICNTTGATFGGRTVHSSEAT